jgi:hypothetical protein
VIVHPELALDQRRDALDGPALGGKARRHRTPAQPSSRPKRIQAPELNPVERIWLYLCKRYLSHRLLVDEEAVPTSRKSLHRRSGMTHPLRAIPDYGSTYAQYV